MVIRELVTFLGFKVDNSGADRYDDRLDRTARRAEAAIQRVGDATGSFNRGASGFLNRLGEFAENMEELGQAAYLLGMAIFAIPLAGDRMLQSLGAINAEIDDTAKSAEVYEQLYQVVRRTGAGVMETAKSFGSFQSAIEATGRSTDDAIGLIAGLQAAMANANRPREEIGKTIDKVGKALERGGKMAQGAFEALSDIPGLQKHLEGAFGATGDKLREMAKAGKITRDQLVAAMLDFAKASRAGLENLPVLMSREFWGLVTTIERFGAEIDQAFGFSERWARAFRAVSDALERWRPYIPMVAALVDQFGGMQAIVAALGLALAAAFGPRILSLVTMLSTAIGVMLRRLLLMAAPVLLIQDFFLWMMNNGTDTLFGRAFGDFPAAFAPLLAILQQVQASFLAYLPSLETLRAKFFEVGDAIRAALTTEGMSGDALATLEMLRSLGVAVFDALKAIVLSTVRDVEMLAGVFGALAGWFGANWPGILSFLNRMDELALSIARTVADVLVGAFNAVGSAIQSMFSGARTALDWIGNKLEALRQNRDALRGAAPMGDPSGALSPLPQSFIPSVTPGASVGSSAVNAPQSIQQNFGGVTVHATGASGAEVASGAMKGVKAAGSEMLSDLGGLARGLSISMPRVEPAAA